MRYPSLRRLLDSVRRALSAGWGRVQSTVRLCRSQGRRGTWARLRAWILAEGEAPGDEDTITLRPLPGRMRDRPSGSSSFAAGLAFLMSACALAISVYFHQAQLGAAVERLLHSRATATHRPAETQRESASSGGDRTHLRVTLPEDEQQSIQRAMLNWLALVRPTLSRDDRLRQLERLAGIVKHEVSGLTDSGFESDDPFPLDITAACVAGNRRRRDLILAVGPAVPYSEGFSFAVWWQDGLYGVQQLNQDAYDYDDDDIAIAEGGLAALRAVDFDRDGTEEVMVCWRMGRGAYFHMTLQRRTTDLKWHRVWSCQGAYQGYAAVTKRPGNRCLGLVVLQAFDDERHWAPSPYYVQEYQWDRKLGTLKLFREGYTDSELDPEDLLGATSFAGLPKWLCLVPPPGR